MARYIKQEILDVKDRSKKRCYYRLESRECITQDKVIDYICRPGRYGISKGEAMSVLTHLAEALEYFLARGHSVRINDVGVFSLSLGLKKGRAAENVEDGETERNAQSICVRGINLRVDKRMLRYLNDDCPLERGRTSRISRSPYSREERLQMAKDFVAEHGAMRVADYVSLTKLSRNKACAELREFASDATSGITSSGRYSTLVYVASHQ